MKTKMNPLRFAYTQTCSGRYPNKNENCHHFYTTSATRAIENNTVKQKVEMTSTKTFLLKLYMNRILIIWIFAMGCSTITYAQNGPKCYD